MIFHLNIVAYIPFWDKEWRGCRSSHTFSITKSLDIDMTSTIVWSCQPTSGLHPTTNISRNTMANFISPPINHQNIYSGHGTHLKNRKILWSSWDNHYLIHHDHQQPDATTSAIPISTNSRSTKAPCTRHWHHPLHPANISESPNIWPAWDIHFLIHHDRLTSPTPQSAPLSPPHLPPRQLHQS